VKGHTSNKRNDTSNWGGKRRGRTDHPQKETERKKCLSNKGKINRNLRKKKESSVRIYGKRGGEKGDPVRLTGKKKNRRKSKGRVVLY